MGDLTSRGYGTVLWEPDDKTVRDARVTRFMTWLAGRGTLDVGGYQDLWHWSVTDPAAFWSAVWDYFGVLGDRGDGPVLDGQVMPDVQWFGGATLNYARNALRTAWTDPDRTAIIFDSERGRAGSLSYGDLAQQVARVARGLAGLGVGPGDRVAALLPNVPEAVVGLLAAASLGAIWSSCSPDFGAQSVIDRFAQIEPTVLIVCDGYAYNGKEYSRAEMVAEVTAALPGLSAVVQVNLVGDAAPPEGALRWDDLGSDGDSARARVRGGAVRAPALGGLLLRHHRPAEADHARSRRRRPRAPQGALVPPGPAPGRRVHLVHHDRLDDVELPGRRPAGRGDDRAVRRQRHVPGNGPAVAAGRRARRHVPGRRRALPGGLHEGGAAPGRRGRPAGAARHRLDRVAAAARGVRLGVRGGQAGPAARLLFRRHRPVHGVRRSVPAAAGAGRGDLGALPGRRGGSLRRGRQAGHRPGRRAGDHPADAVDAGRLLERPGRSQVPGELLRHVPRDLAARRLDRDPAGRRLHHLRPFRRHAQPRRRPDGHQRVLPRGGGVRRGRRQPGRGHRPARRRGAADPVRAARRGRRARRRPEEPAPRGAPGAAVAAARARRDPPGAGHTADPFR